MVLLVLTYDKNRILVMLFYTFSVRNKKILTKHALGTINYSFIDSFMNFNTDLGQK